jgi:hypothetical protein
MKKHRGLKRYYKNLALHNDFDQMTWLDFDNPDTWPLNWHQHFDYNGYGNGSFKSRKPHLDKLFRHFEILEQKVISLSECFQLYAIILDFDSHSDALFLNKPNASGNAFPFKLADLASESTLTNKQLENYIGNLQGYKILYGKADESFCLIYKADLVQSFE